MYNNEYRYNFVFFFLIKWGRHVCTESYVCLWSGLFDVLGRFTTYDIPVVFLSCGLCRTVDTPVLSGHLFRIPARSLLLRVPGLQKKKSKQVPDEV